VLAHEYHKAEDCMWSRRRKSNLTIGIAPLLFFAALSADARAQSGFTVRGLVVERGPDRRPIAGATIRLGEQYQAESNPSGEFEITNVRPGRYGLVVEALGFAPAQTVLVVREDTEGTIQLDPLPLPLDTLVVEPAIFNLRGRIVDQETGRSVPYVLVRTRNAETSTNDAGGFRLRNRARGPHVIRVEGFGWIPRDTLIVLESDTVVTLSLEPDPITARDINAQIERLSIRSRSEADSRYEVDRETILESRGASPIDILKSPGAVRIWECPDRSRLCSYVGSPPRPQIPSVCVDDRKVFGLEVLQLYPNAMIHHIEILGGGRRIRAYTTDFIEDMVAGRIHLQPYNPYSGC
jgi:hypothetical protein